MGSNAPPSDLLIAHDPEAVCKWLCLYAIETKREDAKPATIKNLISGLLQGNKAPFSILDRHNTRFCKFSDTLDSVSSKLHKEGIGVNASMMRFYSGQRAFWVFHHP